MKRILIAILFLAMVGSVEAKLLLTEVMYEPTQTASQTDSEWIEVYNDGSEAIDLSSWKVDGNNFEDVVLGPGQYLVIARELTDGTDTDTDSFESYWGNNDGIWDDGFLAVDGYFSLSDSEDTINVSNGSVSEVFHYTSSLGGNGNGRSIVMANYSTGEWEEGKADGTPGRGEGSSGNEVDVTAEVADIPPEFLSAEMTDDMPDEGIQVMPSSDNVTVTAVVRDLNGEDDIEAVTATIGEVNFSLAKANATNTTATYVASFRMPDTLAAGTHTLELEASDGTSAAVHSMTFEYLSVISTSILPLVISFNDIAPGNVTDAVSVTVLNDGNTRIDLEIEGTALSSGNATLPTSSMEYSDGEKWMQLSKSSAALGLSIGAGASSALQFRMNVPESTKAATYKGKIRIIARTA